MMNDSSAFEWCFLLRPMGYYLIFLWILGTILNGSILYVVIANKKLRSSSTNIFILGLIFADFLGSFIVIPMPAFSLISCRWIFSYIGCVFEAMAACFTGCSNMYMLCVISVDRYLVISKQRSRKFCTVQRSYILILMVYGIAMLWSTMPIFGWSKYDYEGLGVSCSIQWEDHSWNVISYNMAIFILVFLLPVIIILITNIRIYLIIRDRCRYSVTNSNPLYLRRKYRMERHVLHTVSVIIVGFLLAWTPYATAVFVRVFIDAHRFPPIISTLPALFAKMSVIWNPLIYILRNGNFRRSAGSLI